MSASSNPVRAATVWRPGNELSVDELHALLRLRVDVFVVEQNCAYPEVDGRDLLETTTHGWITIDGVLVASVRVLGASDPAQIGRVVTSASHRGHGHAARLVCEAHTDVCGSHSFLEAQSYLVGWYSQLGWVTSGAEFIEDGIAHTPMTRQG